MNVLELVQEFCGKKTLPVPTSVVGNTDVGVVQIRYLLTETLRELGKYKFQEQKIEIEWTAVAAEAQGNIYTLFPGFDSFVPATFWDLTLKRPVFGPVGDASWANLQAFTASGPIYQYKVFANQLHIFPAPATDQLYVIYQSTYPLLDVALGTPIPAIAADTNVFLLPDDVVTRSLDFRWKRQKGESWETDYNEYLDLLTKAVQKTGLPNIHLDNARFKLSPGIWVPAGDWPH